MLQGLPLGGGVEGVEDLLGQVDDVEVLQEDQEVGEEVDVESDAERDQVEQDYQESLEPGPGLHLLPESVGEVPAGEQHQGGPSVLAGRVQGDQVF